MQKKILVFGFFLVFMALFAVLFLVPSNETNNNVSVNLTKENNNNSKNVNVVSVLFPKDYEVKEFLNDKRELILEKPELNIEIKISNPKPTLTLTKWNEVEFTISSAENASNNSILSTDGNKIIYSNNSFDEIFYDTNEGYEYEIKLKTKPEKNTLTFNFNSTELSFFFQDEITEYELSLLRESPEYKKLTDNELKRFIRPEKILYSYAVYHKNKTGDFSQTGGENYKSGKAFHIYRPKAHDSIGNEVWADLNINEQTNTLTVTVPQSFLDSAVYPVIVDPTIGYTTHGSSGPWYGYPNPLASLVDTYTASSGDTITQYTFYGQASGSRNGPFGAYSISGGAPDSLLATGVVLTSPLDNTITEHTTNAVSQSLSAGVEYGIAMARNTGSDLGKMYDSSGSDSVHDSSSSTLPDPWSSAGSYINAKWSWWATYTSGGGGSSCDSNALNTNWTIVDACFFKDVNINIGTGVLSVSCGGVVGLDNAFVLTSADYWSVEGCVNEENPVRRKNGGDVVLIPN